MEANLCESVGKVKRWFTFFLSVKEKEIKSVKLTGENVWEAFEELISESSELLPEVRTLTIYNRYHSFFYISHFKNIESLQLRGTPKLEFPDLSEMNRLRSIRVNSYSKETAFKNLSTAPNLEELWIGDFTIGPAIKITSFDEIIACSKIKKLYLGNVKFSENEIKRIINLPHLEELYLPQRVETKTLAFLTAKLKNVKSKALKPWQKSTLPGKDVKINGKRKPYLNSETDQKRIKKYEKDFEELVKEFSS